MRLNTCKTDKIERLLEAQRLEDERPERDVDDSEPSVAEAAGYQFVTGVQTKRMLDLYESGLSASEVGRRVGRPARTVTDVLRRNNVAVRRHVSIKDTDMPEMIRLYESGLSCAKIALIMGVSRSNISQRLVYSGVRLRNKSEAAALRIQHSQGRAR